MAYEENLETISVPASGDLSSHQHKIMQNSATGAALAAVGTDQLGVLQNNPSALGRAAAIGISGISKVQCRSTIAIGDLVAADANGLGTAVLASSIATPCIGRAMEAVASTSAVIISVLLDQQTIQASS